VASLLSFLIEAAYPDAHRDGSAASEPYRSLRLIGLIRTLIDYGKHLIISARQCAGTADFLTFAAPFGTSSLKLLVARIHCAINRALRLEQKLQYEAGLGGGGYRPEQARPAAARDGTPRAGSAAACARIGRARQARDPELAHLPTVAQIAAEIRRLPLQQVIAMICGDLGITPQHPLWQQLDQALAGFGVSLPVPVSEHEPTLAAAEPSADPPQAAASAAPAQRPLPMAPRQEQSPLCTGPPVSADNRTAVA
jgi:hypothetical protein